MNSTTTVTAEPQFPPIEHLLAQTNDGITRAQTRLEYPKWTIQWTIRNFYQRAGLDHIDHDVNPEDGKQQALLRTIFNMVPPLRCQAEIRWALIDAEHDPLRADIAVRLNTRTGAKRLSDAVEWGLCERAEEREVNELGNRFNTNGVIARDDKL